MFDDVLIQVTEYIQIWTDNQLKSGDYLYFTLSYYRRWEDKRRDLSIELSWIQGAKEPASELLLEWIPMKLRPPSVLIYALYVN